MNELALFSGAGGGILGGLLLGWRTVAAVEIEEYPRAVLLQRQLDGILPRFPIWDDIRTFDGYQWRGVVDVISGGFPCQDVSIAGKGAGISGERSGLWTEMARIIGEVRPRYVFVENSPALTFRGLGDVLGDLASRGYDAEWTVLGARDVGAPHKRDRIWILGYAIGERLEGFSGHESDGSEPGRIEEKQDGSVSQASIRWWDIDPADLPDTISDDQRSAQREAEGIGGHREETEDFSMRGELRSDPRDSRGVWPVESRMDRVVNGLPYRVDRIKAIGNAQVSQVARIAWETLMERIK